MLPLPERVNLRDGSPTPQRQGSASPYTWRQSLNGNSGGAGVGWRSASWPRLALRIAAGGVMCAGYVVAPSAEPAAGAEGMAASAVFAIPGALASASITAPASANIGSARPG